jgi:hypothetical protein
MALRAGAPMRRRQIEHRPPNYCHRINGDKSMTDKTQPTAAPAGQIDPKTQKELMRQAGIWIESSTLFEDDLPARELKAVQAEQHHLDLYTQLVAQRAALQAAPPAPAAVPVLYVSPAQLEKHLDLEGAENAEAGRYLPARKTPAGKFTQPLYALAAAPAQTVALLSAVELPDVEAMGRVPPGWQPVPVEPTEEMARAFRADDAPHYFVMTTVRCADFGERYRAALAAAPRPPAAKDRYRLLVRGVDTIQAEDEFLQDDAVTWQPDTNGIFVGMTYVGNVLLPARRAIKAGP